MRNARRAPARPPARLLRVAWLAGISLASMSLAAGCSDCNKPSGDDTPPDAADDAAPAPNLLRTGPEGGGALNATPLPTASVAKMVNPSELPAYAGPTGSIEGTITVTGDRAPETPADFSHCPEASSTWGHAFRESPGGKNGSRLLADAIVVVTGYKGFYIPEKEEAKEVTIADCAYTTRTATLTFGQRLEVKNVSKEFWTPMLEPQGAVMLSVLIPRGDPAKMYPKKPGHYLLLDHDRKYAVVDVYAFLHPLHTASDVAGHYRIDGIPVGKLTVSTTHPHIDATAEVQVDIVDGIVKTVDLSLKNTNREAGAPLVDAGAPDAAFHPPVH
jgi:hypothetical protein